VSARLVFAEPDHPSVGPFGGLADWYRNGDSPEARAARADINAWYATFPDRAGMLVSRLQGNNDLAIQQATGELYSHHLLAANYDLSYEEDENSPDFRLYRSNEYAAGVEVLSLFSDEYFTELQSRNAAFVDEINRRVPADRWYLKMDIIDWKRGPRVGDIAQWLERTMAVLSPPREGVSHEDFPSALYSDGGVEIAFDFIPRPASSAGSGASIVGIGPAVWGFSRSAFRLRRSLSQKAGGRYDHRGKPFAVLVCVRDISCSTEEIVNALYGDAAITFSRARPDEVTGTRRKNGTFGRSQGNPDGRNRRLGCVYALMRGWAPGSPREPLVVRYDNPFDNVPFPEDVLTPKSRLVAIHADMTTHMEWQPSPPEP